MRNLDLGLLMPNTIFKGCLKLEGICSFSIWPQGGSKNTYILQVDTSLYIASQLNMFDNIFYHLLHQFTSLIFVFWLGWHKTPFIFFPLHFTVSSVGGSLSVWLALNDLLGELVENQEWLTARLDDLAVTLVPVHLQSSVLSHLQAHLKCSTGLSVMPMAVRAVSISGFFPRSSHLVFTLVSVHHEKWRDFE